MDIKSRQQGNVLVVDMAGRLDTSTSGGAYDATMSLAKGGPKRVILDLSKLDYVSSAGLRIILTFAKFLQAAGAEMRICNPQPPVREVLEASGFNSLIKIFDDEKTALAGW
jgi:anti-anti-sigma factor